jgi:hypothetical protein
MKSKYGALEKWKWNDMEYVIGYIIGALITSICIGLFTDIDMLDDDIPGIFIVAFWPIAWFVVGVFCIGLLLCSPAWLIRKLKKKFEK